MRVFASTSHLSRRQFLQAGGFGFGWLSSSHSANANSIELRNIHPTVSGVGTPQHDSQIFRPVWRFDLNEEINGGSHFVEIDAFPERIKRHRDVERAQIKVFQRNAGQISQDFTFIVRNGRPILQYGNINQKPSDQHMDLAHQAIDFLFQHNPSRDEATEIYRRLTGYHQLPSQIDLAMFKRPTGSIA